jgi:hypothetical protein
MLRLFYCETFDDNSSGDLFVWAADVDEAMVIWRKHWHVVGRPDSVWHVPHEPPAEPGVLAQGTVVYQKSRKR